MLAYPKFKVETHFFTGPLLPSCTHQKVLSSAPLNNNMTTPFCPHPVRLVLRNVLVGCGAASFWRGSWYLLDDNLYPNDPTKSAASSLVAGTVGMLASQGLVQRALAKPSTTHLLKQQTLRFGAVYTIAVSCVLVWRGVWLGWDILYEKLHKGVHLTLHSPASWHASRTSFLHHSVYDQLHEDSSVDATDRGHATKSGLLSHVAACFFLLGLGRFASVLAPPAAVSLIRDVTVNSGANIAKRGLFPKKPRPVRIFRAKQARKFSSRSNK